MSRRNSLAEKAKRREERKAPKKPGSLKPFHRIRALVDALTKAQQTVLDLVEAHKPSWLSKLFGRNTPTPEQAKIVLDAQEAVVRAQDAVLAYRSRGHGRGKFSPRFGNKPGKYTPHEGTQERERRFM